MPASAPAEVFEVSDTPGLAAALRDVRAGDSVVLADGTYVINATIDAVLDGTVEAPIVIEGAAGARPVLQGPPTGTLRLSATHTRLSGLEFAGEGTGISFTIADTVSLRELVFSSGPSGIECVDCTGLVLDSSEFTGTGPGPAFDAAFLNASDLVGNYVHDTTGPGFVVAGVDNRVLDNVVVSVAGDGIAVTDDSGGVLGNLIDGNFVRGAGIVLGGSGTVQNNVASEAPGVGITSDLSVPGDLDVFVLHNTVVDAATCFAAVDWPSSTGASVVANNALYCADGAATLFESGVAQNTVVTSNIYLGSSDFPGDSTLGNDTATEFADAAAGNFYPADGSALIDAGDPDYGAAIDFNGAGRSVPPDVGAYERGQGSNPFPNPGDGFKFGGSAPGGDDAGGSADAGIDADAGGGASGGNSGPRGNVNSGEGYEPREEDGCQCSSAGGAGTSLLVLFVGFVLAASRIRKKSSAA